MNNSYNKYLKYKNKYLQLKKLIGGEKTYKKLKYLCEGADNFAFLMEDNNILRIRKACEKLSSQEKDVMTSMVDKNILYFVKIIATGNCNDLKDKLKNDITDFCDTDVVENICSYDYVILGNAPGTNFLNYFISEFKDLLQSDDFDTLIENQTNIDKLESHTILLISFLSKIIDGLIDANNKLNGFKHGDFNDRNCHIDIDTKNPIIFDFGNSSIGEKGMGEDIFTYIRDILSDSTIGSSNFSYSITNFEELSVEVRTKIKNNFYKLNNKLRINSKIQSLIQKYFNQNTTCFGGIRLSVKDNSVPLETIKLILA